MRPASRPSSSGQIASSVAALDLLPAGHWIDSSNCHREPIHTIGEWMVYAGPFTRKAQVTHASSNAESMLGIVPVGHTLGDIFKVQDPQTLVTTDLQHHLLPCLANDCMMLLHTHRNVQNSYLVEVEPYTPVSIDTSMRQNQELTKLLSATDYSTTQKDMLEIVAEYVRTATGYDRVLVYEFDRYWNGVVIVERTKGERRYLGLRFPSSDIPPLARLLYFANPVRVVCSIDAEPASMTPRNLDMSQCALRGVSAIHKQYLRNIGVAASSSVSLILKDGMTERLWGLLVCHHGSDKVLPFQAREHLSVLGKVISLRLEQMSQLQTYLTNAQIGSTLSILRAQLSDCHKLDAFVSHLVKLAPQIMASYQCDGVVLRAANDAYIITGNAGKIYKTIFARAKELHAAGRVQFSNSVAIDLNIPPDPDCASVLCLSPEAEITKEVTWDGFQAGVMMDLNPEHSFEVWRLTSKGRGKPWEHTILADAQELSVVLTEHLLRIKEMEAQAAANEARKEREAAQQTALHVLQQESTRKDCFLAALSHELRTPLTPVLLVLEDLETEERQSLSTEALRDVRLAKESVLMEVQLIDDLLDVVRIAKGKITYAPIPLDLHELLNVVYTMLRSAFAEKQLQFSLNMTAQNPWVVAESARLQQVFLNLLKNALKFTPVGGRVEVRTWNETSNINVEVSDNGIGICPESLVSIFEAFNQGHADMKEFGGLGLGLSIVKGLVELHGGTVKAVSAVTHAGRDRGSTFTVSLPSSASRHSRMTGGGAGLGESRHVLNILLVEDNDPTRLLLSHILEGRFGHKVWCASTLHEALERGNERRFDLLISDIGLPDGSGLELVGPLRSISPNLASIALTGFGSDEDRGRTQRAGFHVHLTKPVRTAELKRALEELFPPNND